MHSGMAYMISNIILTVFWMIAANIILDGKYSKIKTILIESGIQLLFWFVFEHYFTLLAASRIAVGIVLLCLLLQYFHTDGIFFKLITSLFIYVTSFVSEIILGSFLSLKVIVSGEIFAKYDVAVYSVYLLLNFTFLSLATAALRTYKQHHNGLLMEKQWFIFFLFPLSQVINMVAWWPEYLKYNMLGNPYKVVVLTTFSIFADIALIYELWLTSVNSEWKIRSELLEEQVRSQVNFYDQLASTYSSIRKMRHDIDNHIYAIEGLINNNEIKKASDYIHQIRQEDYSAVRFADCRNTIASSYLSKKADDLSKTGILFETDIHLPALPEVSDLDLISIYGNMLDNAMEACKNIPDPVISLKTNYKQPYLFISCTNPVTKSTEKKNRRVPELERGIGFTILSNLAAQYDGHFTTKTENDMFNAELILKVKTGDKNA